MADEPQRETVSIMDFGPCGNGNPEEDGAAFAAALNRLAQGRTE